MTTDAMSDVCDQLDGLTADQKAAINDWLTNDEASSDEEFVDHLVDSLGLTRAQADLVVSYRPRAMSEVDFELFPGFHAF